MGDKLYSEPTSYSNINNMYTRAPCAKQGYDPNNQQYYSYNLPISNNYNQSNNVLDPFNVISPSNYHKSQNVCLYPSQLDMPNWDNRICDDVIKIPDKIEMIEITSKDLSPASYCSNLDLFVPEFYKSLGKDVNYLNKYESQCQWFSNSGSYSNSQKVTEYPSCAQSGQNNNLHDKTVKYCSIQNVQKEFDYNATVRNYTYNSDLTYNEQNYACKNITDKSSLTTDATPQDFGSIYNSYYDGNKLQESVQNQFFDLPPESFQTIDQQTEGSNEESDIIVEESEDEVTDCEKLPSQVTCCVICNISYTPLGTQFYYLTHHSPLTMSSQKPVFTKIVNIVGNISNKINYLCSECLGLINTIDHLQLKLDNFRAELTMKFQQTCQSNNVPYHQITAPRKRKKYKAVEDAKLKCKICKAVLSLRKFCRIHYLKRHKSSGYLCEQCGEISSTRNRFKIHYNKHKIKIPKIDSFKCSNCPKIFRTKSNLVEHENYCLGLLPYGCKFCDKRFASTTKLKNHVRLKHDKKFIAICSICNIGFVKLSDYKSHKISHSTDKKFSCTKCDKSYKTLSNLNFHMKVHNDKLPFICEICDKGFMRKEYLEAHVNNHTGVKNFSCNICDKKFVSQKNLDSHMKYHDGSAKTKTCNVCGKVMTTGFEEHLRIHNNLREFECDQCDCRFNTKGTLAKHKKRKHPC